MNEWGRRGYEWGERLDQDMRKDDTPYVRDTGMKGVDRMACRPFTHFSSPLSPRLWALPLTIGSLRGPPDERGEERRVEWWVTMGVASSLPPLSPTFTPHPHSSHSSILSYFLLLLSVIHFLSSESIETFTNGMLEINIFYSFLVIFISITFLLLLTFYLIFTL